MLELAKNNRQRALVALCGLAGLRVAEALSVTPMWFNTGDMTLTIRGKGDKTRVVPLSARAWQEIAPAVSDAILDGRVTVVDYKDRFARTLIRNLGKRAGLRRPVASHDLRATFATAAYDRSLDLRAVQELLGHANSKQTEVYTEVPIHRMRGALPE